jgi:glycosyltransferase involved in cell wall biosynthesis
MLKSSIKVLALMPYPPDTTPSQRFRIEQWLPYLEEQGIVVEIMPFADESMLRLLHKPGRRVAKAMANVRRFVERFSDVIAARRYDVVLIHRAVCISGPAILERFIAALGRPIIYDFDDAIFVLHTTDVNRRFAWLKFPGKTASICRISSHVVVGNSWLADYARQYNSRVSVIPTSIDTGHYQPAKRPRSNGRVIVGWTGSSTSQTYLEVFAPVLKELIARRDVEIRVISNREPSLPGIPHQWRSWSPETEVEELSQFDIGIMPMPDEEWARGKCALKALQYMAGGTPTICSAIGANCEVIQSGENGLLATTSDEWLSQLEKLIDDAGLRSRLGIAGRKTVEERYSMHRSADLFAQVVRSVVSDQPARTSGHHQSVVSSQQSTFKGRGDS